MCKNLTAISFMVLELQVTKVEKSDVCNWRVFANPVTNLIYLLFIIITLEKQRKLFVQGYNLEVQDVMKFRM